MSESGPFYKTFIDPLLTWMRKHVASEIKSDESVIDIACGTGAQVFEYSGKAKRVVGIDFSDSMISVAKKESTRRNITNAEFYNADAGNLKEFQDNEFEVATMSLALHQFDPEAYNSILGEMKRISKRIVIADYAFPQPGGLKQFAVNSIEFLAGKEHYRNFKKFNKKGGLQTILKEHQLVVIKEKKMGSGIFCLVECEKLK